MSTLLVGYPVTVPLTLQWGEMDAYQHLNNVVYFRYFETSRIAYFRAMGLTDDTAAVRPILASTACRFRAPLHYPDQVTVGARVTEVGEDRFGMEYAVASERLGRVAAEGQALLVAYDYRAGLKAPVPAPWREAIARLEGRG